MAPMTAPSNPKPKSPNNYVVHIGGIRVEFPYKPYGPQLAFMGRVISTLDRAQRGGHCHALLESPTGTGKSLSLLCSTLAWQQHHRTKSLLQQNIPHSMPDPEVMSDPLGRGGGFIPETPSSRYTEQSIPVANGNNKTNKPTPTIFYASRTHSQITQLIREYRKTAYRVPMVVLASRKHYCTNAHVRGKDNVDEACKLLLKDREVGCLEFKNYHKVRGHPSLQKGGCNEAHDIEDLVKIGETVKGCSYYAAVYMAEDAQLVFCPYNYIINPVVRRAVDINIEGAIVILDEAHNIEDIARDGGSVDIEAGIFHELQRELGQLCLTNPSIYQPLLDMIEGIVCWMDRRKSTLETREFQHYFSCWTGDKAVKELQEANISLQCFPILKECATKAIKAAADLESDVPHLSGMSATTLESLISSLCYFFSGNGSHIYDYQLCLHHIKRDAGNSSGHGMYTFNLWCLNPAVVFKGISDLCQSVILTSGTLSPMNSFSSELGVQFGTCLEAPHVIDIESQLWTGVTHMGPSNQLLNASFKTADGYAFQDELGTSLEEIFKIVPGGSLVFFPSYKLLEKLCNRWQETGQFARLEAQKPLFLEPRGGAPDDFETVLKSYYDCIRQGKKPIVRSKRSQKKMNSWLETKLSTENSKKKGAAFLAVFRGKVSEGIDFSDENARSVIVIGIPFANINDIQVAQKKKYNDTYKSSKNLLSGSEWYCQQAFRALNQAAGRCIRHRFDYGAIILLDDRFREERNTTHISKWLRKSIRQYNSFDMSLQSLKSFFRDIEERIGNRITNVCQSSDDNVEIIPFEKLNKRFKGKKNHSLDVSDYFAKEAGLNCTLKVQNPTEFSQPLPSITKLDSSLSKIKSQGSDRVRAHVLIHEDNNSTCRNYINLEAEEEADIRCCNGANKEYVCGSPEISLVKETPVTYDSNNMTSPQSLLRSDNYSSTINQAANVLCSKPFTCSEGVPSESIHECLVTPERNVTANTVSETESSLNSSVNSHFQKRRTSISSPTVNLIKELSDAPDAKTSAHIRNMQNPTPRNCANSKIEYGDGQTSEKSMDIGVSYVSPCPPMDKRLQIFCSSCKNSLGLPMNKHYVMCSLTSLFKVHLATLLNINKSTSVPVVISDISSVDKRLWDNKGTESGSGQGIWCEEDGCVFSTIFCPFCTASDRCLGVQIRATDSLNVQLLNKVLFYVDRLQIKSPESVRDEESSTVNSELSEVPVSCPIEKYAFSPQSQNSGGWRTTKSKLRLPKRGRQ